jgi:hypothetical protein
MHLGAACCCPKYCCSPLVLLKSFGLRIFNGFVPARAEDCHPLLGPREQRDVGVLRKRPPLGLILIRPLSAAETADRWGKIEPRAGVFPEARNECPGLPTREGLEPLSCQADHQPRPLRVPLLPADPPPGRPHAPREHDGA